MTLRIEVDRTTCMGSGNCAFHAPRTFDLDDEMLVVVLDPGGDDPATVRLAADGCPTRSIRVHDADGAAAVDAGAGR